MSGPEIAHFLKEYGDGDELSGVVNVFLTGTAVGVGGTVIIGVAGYSIYRLGRWGMKKVNQYLATKDIKDQRFLKSA